MSGVSGDLGSATRVGRAQWKRPERPPLAQIAAGLAAVGLAVSVWVWGFALPSAPKEVWVPVDVSLDIKPWASAHHAPGGTPVALPGWFEEPDGGCPGIWEETLLVRLETETPLLRKGVVSVISGRNATWSTVARYRFTGERQDVGGEPWGRYIRDD